MLYRIQCSHKLTIEKLIKISGLNDSTLRYWEKLGLISSVPRFEKKSKRIYLGGVILILQQIILFKRAGMSLGEIKRKISIIRSENANILIEQNRNLKKELNYLARIIRTISRTICVLKGKHIYGNLSDYEMLNCFKKKEKDGLYYRGLSKLLAEISDG
jgi:DNA-binding transcriptional MerR regulator